MDELNNTEAAANPQAITAVVFAAGMKEVWAGRQNATCNVGAEQAELPAAYLTRFDEVLQLEANFDVAARYLVSLLPPGILADMPLLGKLVVHVAGPFGAFVEEQENTTGAWPVEPFWRHWLQGLIEKIRVRWSIPYEWPQEERAFVVAFSLAIPAAQVDDQVSAVPSFLRPGVGSGGQNAAQLFTRYWVFSNDFASPVEEGWRIVRAAVEARGQTLSVACERTELYLGSVGRNVQIIRDTDYLRGRVIAHGSVQTGAAPGSA